MRMLVSVFTVHGLPGAFYSIPHIDFALAHSPLSNRKQLRRSPF